MEGNMVEKTDEELEAISAELKKNGISLSALGSPIGKFEIDEPFEVHLKTFERALAACKILGTNRMRIFSFHLDNERVAECREEVMRRMSLLGIEILVFGSGPARRVPADMDIDAGRDELRRFLTMCGALGEQYGVTLVIEPLNPNECNAINTPQAALEMAASVNSPRVAYLADAYHMAGSDVAPDALDYVAVLPQHIHVAEPPKRTCPGGLGGEYLKAFSASLRGTDYAARVSVECDFKDVADELPKAKAFLDEWF
jgi:sugar phosphate isomerase/epimerase